MKDLLLRLLRHKAWANAMLLDAFAALGDAHPATGLTARALAHTHVVDRIFLAHLRGERHGYASANPAQVPAWEALASDIRATDQALLAYAATLDEAAMAERLRFTFTDGAPGCMSRAEMLMHLVTHGAGHRGQVSAVQLLHGLVPEPNGFTTWLHAAEPAERGRGGPSSRPQAAAVEATA